MVYTRTIEKNNGLQVVEVRHIEKSRGAKILYPGSKVEFSLGKPEETVLTMMDGGERGHGYRLDSPEPVAKALGATAPDKAKAFGGVGRIQGSKVRVNWIDGLGV